MSFPVYIAKKNVKSVIDSASIALNDAAYGLSAERSFLSMLVSVNVSGICQSRSQSLLAFWSAGETQGKTLRTSFEMILIRVSDPI